MNLISSNRGSQLTSVSSPDVWLLKFWMRVLLGLGLYGSGIGVSGPGVAQISPDATLGAESSRVVSTPLNEVVEGGALRGRNLFHSFQEFNVNAGQRVYFANPVGVQSIFGRVTGGSVSNILGTLGVNGGANLFLLNPQGFLFGPNATLDIRGSFLATTGDRFLFPDNQAFGVDTPTAPLLTVSVPSGVQYGGTPGPIRSQGNLAADQDLTLAAGNLNVEGTVQAGGNLTLQAQDTVTIRDSFLSTASSQSSDSGSISIQGSVVNINTSDINTDVANGIAGDINIQGSVVNINTSDINTDVVNGIAGDINIQGSVVNINTSNINTNADNGIAGDVNIQADASSGTALTLTNTRIDAAAFGRQGKAGSVILNATNRGDITLQGGLQGRRIFSDTFGNQLTEGIRVYGGNITIDNYTLDASARSSIAGGNILIDGYAIILSNQAKLTTEVEGTEDGTSGNISITGNSLSLAGGSQIAAQVNAGSVGNAGNIDFTIQGVTSLVGTDTKIVNSVETGATGNGGVITLKGSGLPVSSGGITNVQASSLLIQDGASLESSTLGTGNAGNISITVQDVVLQNGNISSSVKDGARGNAGAVEITSDRFSMSSPGSPSINTRITGRVDSGGEGNGANITINTRVASIDNSAISFSTSGIGDAGLLTINAQNLTLRSNAALVGDVGSGGSGRGGSIRFNVTDTLLIDGATDPGVSIAGTGESTRITAGIGPGGSGQGGDVRIQAGTFLMRNGAIIKNSTRGTGDAGDVNITAGQVDISGSVPQSGLPSGLFTSTSNEFKAGDITIQTGTFRIADGSALNAQSLSSGNGGDITVNATNSFTALTGGQLITTTFGAGKAGDIQVTSPNVTIAGSDPFYSARIAKFPNPVNPGVANAITQTGASSGLFANAIGSSTTTGLGAGGDIRVISSKILLQDNAGLRVDSRSTNPTANTKNSAGKIEISTNQLKLDNNAFITAETSNGNGGDINIFARDFLLMRRNSLISTTAGTEQQGGSGGTITITAAKGFIVAVPSENSDIIANAFGGNGGKITLSTNRIFGLTQRSRLTPTELQEIRTNRSSDISASSNVGAEGSIAIETLQIDPSQGLTEVPVDLVDPTGLISQGCQPSTGAKANRGEYVVTGRGGLPLGVNAPQTSRDADAPWVSQPQLRSSAQPAPIAAVPLPAPVQPLSGQPLIEAQGIAIAANGTAFLIAQSPTVTPRPASFPQGVCPAAHTAAPQ